MNSTAGANASRVSELAELLATGLMRLWARKSSQKPTKCKESSLHISPAKSGDPKPVTWRGFD